LYVVSMVSGGGRKKNIFQITRVRFYDLCVVISVSAAHVLALQGSALITPPVPPPFPRIYTALSKAAVLCHCLSCRRD
jgi:hypothetical protein